MRNLLILIGVVFSVNVTNAQQVNSVLTTVEFEKDLDCNQNDETNEKQCFLELSASTKSIDDVKATLPATAKKENSSKYLVNLYHGDSNEDANVDLAAHSFFIEDEAEDNLIASVIPANKFLSTNDKVSLYKQGELNKRISLEEYNLDNVNLIVTNNLGEVTKKMFVDHTANTVVDMSDLPDGFYQFSISTNENQVVFDEQGMSGMPEETF